MGLFDIFKRKTDAPLPKGTHVSPPAEQIKATPARTEVSWKQLPPNVPDLWAAFAQEHAAARAQGLQMLLYTYESWSAGSIAMRKFCKDPLAMAVLGNWHVLEIAMDAMDVMNNTEAFTARGLRATYIPQLWTFDANGHIEGFSITGGYWGADTPENIAKGLQRWFENRAAL